MIFPSATGGRHVASAVVSSWGEVCLVSPEAFDESAVVGSGRWVDHVQCREVGRPFDLSFLFVYRVCFVE